MFREVSAFQATTHPPPLCIHDIAMHNMDSDQSKTATIWHWFEQHIKNPINTLDWRAKTTVTT